MSNVIEKVDIQFNVHGAVAEITFTRYAQKVAKAKKCKCLWSHLNLYMLCISGITFIMYVHSQTIAVKFSILRHSWYFVH